MNLALWRTKDSMTSDSFLIPEIEAIVLEVHNKVDSIYMNFANLAHAAAYDML